MRDAHRGDGFVVTLDAPDGGPASLLARAEVHFLEGPLVGLSLRGFSLWRRTSGVLVTVPRVSSEMEFLRRSRIADPTLAERTLTNLVDAILAAHSTP